MNGRQHIHLVSFILLRLGMCFDFLVELSVLFRGPGDKKLYIESCRNPHLIYVFSVSSHEFLLTFWNVGLPLKYIKNRVATTKNKAQYFIMNMNYESRS